MLLPVTQAVNSICDNLLDGGAAFGPNSILNDFSVYGGPFGTHSPFNPDSLTPPQILVDGVVVGNLTVSPFLTDPVDPAALLEHLGCPVDSA